MVRTEDGSDMEHLGGSEQKLHVVMSLYNQLFLCFYTNLGVCLSSLLNYPGRMERRDKLALHTGACVWLQSYQPKQSWDTTALLHSPSSIYKQQHRETPRLSRFSHKIKVTRRLSAAAPPTPPQVPSGSKVPTHLASLLTLLVQPEIAQREIMSFVDISQ